jgi:hypothetical protein
MIELGQKEVQGISRLDLMYRTVYRQRQGPTGFVAGGDVGTKQDLCGLVRRYLSERFQDPIDHIVVALRPQRIAQSRNRCVEPELTDGKRGISPHAWVRIFHQGDNERIQGVRVLHRPECKRRPSADVGSFVRQHHGQCGAVPIYLKINDPLQTDVMHETVPIAKIESFSPTCPTRIAGVQHEND